MRRIRAYVDVRIIVVTRSRGGSTIGHITMKCRAGWVQVDDVHVNGPPASRDGWLVRWKKSVNVFMLKRGG